MKRADNNLEWNGYQEYRWEGRNKIDVRQRSLMKLKGNFGAGIELVRILDIKDQQFK